MAAITHPTTTPSSHLRAFDVRHDLDAVADLVEVCFANTLDADGRRYIQQMRSAARSPSYLLWAAAVAERVSLPLTGFVWEEKGHLVGNLSLIPFTTQGRRLYLIANVAVDPVYRRHGIARELTTRALDYVRERGASSVWLHVREENLAALALYKSLGFVEQTRRTTWESERRLPSTLIWEEHSELADVSIVPRRSHHWSLQRKWLKRVYPPEIAWHMTFRFTALRPGLWGALYRLFSGIQVRQWAALKDNQLLGVLAWHPLFSRSDHLWLATTPEYEDMAIRGLLLHLQRNLASRRELAVEYPAEHASQAFTAAGFTIHQTLIWMKRQFDG
jgi:ribosomal protein S18 acetylase RimI-like enzyme